MNNGTFGPPPPGINLLETQQPRVLGANVGTFCLATILVGLRFLSRRLSRTPLWIDDWLMIPALTFATTMMLTTCVWMVGHGYGLHVWAAPWGPEDATMTWAKGLFISELSYAGIIGCCKFSILAFYWRIFKQSKIRVPIYILGACVVSWMFVMLIITVFQCIPVNGFWERFTPAGHLADKCGVNINHFFDGNAIPNIVTDAAIVVLPIPFVWQLQMPRSQKVALSGIFVLGFFVTGVSIARFTYVVALDLQNPDITWNFVDTQVWSGVECHIDIVCACLPSLRPLLSILMTGSVERAGVRGTIKSHGGHSPSSPGGHNSHSRASMWTSGGGVHTAFSGPGSPRHYQEKFDFSDTDDDSRLFTRLSDAELTGTLPYDKEIESLPSHPPPALVHGLRSEKRDIIVRTDVYIEHEDKPESPVE